MIKEIMIPPFLIPGRSDGGSVEGRGERLGEFLSFGRQLGGYILHNSSQRWPSFPVCAVAAAGSCGGVEERNCVSVCKRGRETNRERSLFCAARVGSMLYFASVQLKVLELRRGKEGGGGRGEGDRS